VNEIEEAFSLSYVDFEAKYHVTKPSVMSERVVIYCEKGKLDEEVAEKLRNLGFNKWVTFIFNRPIFRIVCYLDIQNNDCIFWSLAPREHVTWFYWPLLIAFFTPFFRVKCFPGGFKEWNDVILGDVVSLEESQPWSKGPDITGLASD